MLEMENDYWEVALVILWGVLPLLFAIGILAFCMRRLRDLAVVDALTSDYRGTTLNKVCQMKDERNALRERVADLEKALAENKEIPN